MRKRETRREEDMKGGGDDEDGCGERIMNDNGNADDDFRLPYMAICVLA